jgi:hypothetical protein
LDRAGARLSPQGTQERVRHPISFHACGTQSSPRLAACRMACGCALLPIPNGNRIEALRDACALLQAGRGPLLCCIAKKVRRGGACAKLQATKM